MGRHRQIYQQLLLRQAFFSCYQYEFSHHCIQCLGNSRIFCWKSWLEMSELLGNLCCTLYYFSWKMLIH